MSTIVVLWYMQYVYYIDTEAGVYVVLYCYTSTLLLCSVYTIALLTTVDTVYILL